MLQWFDARCREYVSGNQASEITLLFHSKQFSVIFHTSSFTSENYRASQECTMYTYNVPFLIIAYHVHTCALSAALICRPYNAQFCYRTHAHLYIRTNAHTYFTVELNLDCTCTIYSPHATLRWTDELSQSAPAYKHTSLDRLVGCPSTVVV